jgi:hypothetical protein
MYLRIFGNVKSDKNNWYANRKSENPKIAKIYYPHMSNPQIATFAKATQI